MLEFAPATLAYMTAPCMVEAQLGDPLRRG